jgi:hypothetical protein
MLNLVTLRDGSQVDFKYQIKVELKLMDLYRENLQALFDLWIKCKNTDQPCNSREVLRSWRFLNSNDQVPKNMRNIILNCIIEKDSYIWFNPTSFHTRK